MTSEFRQDIVSGQWVLIATERSKRKPKEKKAPFYQLKEACPFENPVQSNGEPAIVYNRGQRVQWPSEWTTMVIRNKYPALQSGVCAPPRNFGPTHIADANGFHELVITRDHEQSFAHFLEEETLEILMAYRERYKEIAQDDCGAYVLIFHNHGPSAGASIFHNHSQIISTPIIPPYILERIHGSEQYFQKNGKRVHDVMIDWERSEHKRIVYENEKFICLCPFASRTPYEIRIFPKVSSANFEMSNDADLASLADALNTILKKIYVLLDNIDYNFYIHTAPVQKDSSINYDYYRWHIEIAPRIGIAAGFELATAIYINSVDPDQAAAELLNTHA
jgi:UDPglucose--hexose-1-phosphate uridylyltransferase